MDYVTELIRITNTNIFAAQSKCGREIRDALIQELFSKLEFVDKFKLAVRLEKDQIRRLLDKNFPGRFAEDDMPIVIHEIVQTLRSEEKAAGQNRSILFHHVDRPANEPRTKEEVECEAEKAKAYDLNIAKLAMLMNGNIWATAGEMAFERRMTLVNQVFSHLPREERNKMYEISEYRDVRRELAAAFRKVSEQELHERTLGVIADLRQQHFELLRQKLREARGPKSLPPAPSTDNPEDWAPF